MTHACQLCSNVHEILRLPRRWKSVRNDALAAFFRGHAGCCVGGLPEPIIFFVNGFRPWRLLLWGAYMIGWNIAFVRALRATNLSKRAKKSAPYAFLMSRHFLKSSHIFPPNFTPNKCSPLPYFYCYLVQPCWKKNRSWHHRQNALALWFRQGTLFKTDV